MPDALLTNLCGICHLVVPRYTCPRCSIRTCSSACVGKHKVWAACSGVRDATKYLPPRTLKTAWGVDHEYNFLKSVERTMELAEKELVEERGVLQAAELQAPRVTRQTRFQRNSDGSTRAVKVAKIHDPQKDIKVRRIEAHLSRRLGWANTRIDMVPTGMQRQRENGTSFNRKTGLVNWQVEWLVIRPEGEDEDTKESHDDDNDDNDGPRPIKRQKTTRMLSKTLEDVPLYIAFHDLGREQEQKQQKDDDKTAGSSWDKLARTLNPAACIKMTAGAQNRQLSNWEPALVPIQDPTWATWHTTTESATKWPSVDDREKRCAYQYFLSRPKQRDDKQTVVTRLKEGDNLGQVLRNTRVLEFPTIHLLPQGVELGEGFVLGEKDTIPARRKGDDYEEDAFAGRKRRASERGRGRSRGRSRAGGNDHGRKRARTETGSVRREEDELEEGEVDSDDGQDGNVHVVEENDDDDMPNGGFYEPEEDGLESD